MLMRSRASWPFEDVTRRGRRRAPRRRGRSRGTRANARTAPRNEGGGGKDAAGKPIFFSAALWGSHGGGRALGWVRPVAVRNWNGNISAQRSQPQHIREVPTGAGTGHPRTSLRKRLCLAARICGRLAAPSGPCSRARCARKSGYSGGWVPTNSRASFGTPNTNIGI